MQNLHGGQNKSGSDVQKLHPKVSFLGNPAEKAASVTIWKESLISFYPFPCSSTKIMKKMEFASVAIAAAVSQSVALSCCRNVLELMLSSPRCFYVNSPRDQVHRRQLQMTPRLQRSAVRYVPPAVTSIPPQPGGIGKTLRN